MPKVSIIVPVYNVEKYLSKCLNSLVNQTLKDIEIIIVNDGTPDNSQKIIDKYVKEYPKKVRSYLKENGGQGSARNFGLTKAKGKYIGYVDSDDYIELDMYEKLYNKALEMEYDVVVCGNTVVDEDYNIIKKENNMQFDSNITNILFGKMAVWNKIYKKSLIVDNDILFRSNVWYEDLDFTMKTILMANNIGFLNMNLYNYLLRKGSTMNNSNIKRNLEIIDAFEELISFCKQKRIYKKYYNEIEFLAIDHIYISAVVRTINPNNNKKDKREIICKLLNYMNNTFSNYKSNKYIKYLTSNRKIIFSLLNYKLYSIIYLVFKVKNKVKKIR